MYRVQFLIANLQLFYIMFDHMVESRKKLLKYLDQLTNYFKDLPLK